MYEHNFITVEHQFCQSLCNFMYQLRSITASKRIELESPGWSGFVENSKPSFRSYVRTNILYLFFPPPLTVPPFGATDLKAISFSWLVKEVIMYCDLFLCKKEIRCSWFCYNVSMLSWSMNIFFYFVFVILNYPGMEWIAWRENEMEKNLTLFMIGKKYRTSILVTS